MKPILLLLATSLLLSACGKKDESEAAAPQEITWPAAIKQSDESIILYTKNPSTDALNEFVIPPGDPLHKALGKQLSEAAFGVRTPVDISNYQ